MEFHKIKNPLGTLKKIEIFSLQRDGVCTKFVECWGLNLQGVWGGSIVGLKKKTMIAH